MNEVSATFRREIAALPDVFDMVDRFFSGSPADSSLCHTVEFVLEELFTNCVKYNAAGAGGIDISLHRTPEQLLVKIVDRDSEPFDIRTDAPPVDPSAPIEQRTPGRLGVHLVKKLMDRIDYDHTDRVSTITLTKTLR